MTTSDHPSIDIVILAAGKGTRMKSALPKVLHSIAGRPLLQHVIDTAQLLNDAEIIVVTGHGSDQVKSVIVGDSLAFVEQTEQLGTAHAVLQAAPVLRSNSITLILYGDVPLISQSTMENMVAVAERGQVGLLTVTMDNPTGYGRIIRNSSGDVEAIVEQKDANEDQLLVNEVNTGVLALPSDLLNDWLPQIGNNNAQQEYYLTDIISIARHAGVAINTVQPGYPEEVEGVNNRLQLAALERAYQRQQADQLMTAGVTLADPHRIDVRGSLITGTDIFIDVNAVFEGNVSLGSNVVIGPNCHIMNSKIGAGVEIKSNSVIENAVIESHCDVGPFARLRPGTHLSEGSKVGNFVETKNTILGRGSKINHLSYVGDAEVGEKANIGAGTITCNYDGVNKHKTIIGDEAFIGSNSSLVAPVFVGKGTTVGAGSTINKDVPDAQLGIGRAKQVNIDNWQRPTKSPK